MRDLDAPHRFAELDPRGMLACIADLPRQCEEGWQSAYAVRLPDDYRRVEQVVILGVGGSAIAGDLLSAVLLNECRVPVIVHRGYGVPAFVGERSLVIACSYSGNTEETLAGFARAVQRGAKALSITTGGELARRTQESGLPLFTYDYVSQPRAALGYSLMIPLAIMQRLGLVQDKSADVADALVAMRRWQEEVCETVPSAQNAAKSLAKRLFRRMPVVYGAEHLGAVAQRWKAQFNENAKCWAVYDVLPELNHNTVAGYSHPDGLRDLAHVIVLSSTLNHPRIRLRIDITRELLVRHGFTCEAVEARGDSAMAQVLSAIHFGDYVSYYLAMLHAVDPWAIEDIDFVKEQLRD